MRRITILPSILSADFSNLEKEIKKVEDSGIKFLHFDVMDGHFVPNITFGAVLIKSVREITDLTFDVHLMIENPDKYVLDFINAGADLISFHIEASLYPLRIIEKIKENNKKAGIVLNPSTNVETIYNLLEYIDYILIMSVDPGFSGQNFIKFSIDKIKKIKNIIDNKNIDIKIEVDGGINENTYKEVINAGADMLVMGNAFFKNERYKELILNIKEYER